MYLHSLISPYYGLIVSGFNSKSFLLLWTWRNFLGQSVTRSTERARTQRNSRATKGPSGVQAPPWDGYRQALSTPFYPLRISCLTSGAHREGVTLAKVPIARARAINTTFILRKIKNFEKENFISKPTLVRKKVT